MFSKQFRALSINIKYNIKKRTHRDQLLFVRRKYCHYQWLSSLEMITTNERKRKTKVQIVFIDFVFFILFIRGILNHILEEVVDPGQIETIFVFNYELLLLMKLFI